MRRVDRFHGDPGAAGARIPQYSLFRSAESVEGIRQASSPVRFADDGLARISLLRQIARSIKPSRSRGRSGASEIGTVRKAITLTESQGSVIDARVSARPSNDLSMPDDANSS